VKRLNGGYVLELVATILIWGLALWLVVWNSSWM
jgi:hypothetical protein